MGNDANGIVACVKLKFFHLEGGGLNHQRDYQTLKKVPGRKTDVSDAQWLALLACQHNAILARRFRRVPEIPFCFDLISVAFAI
jgi:hypothetical protein